MGDNLIKCSCDGLIADCPDCGGGGWVDRRFEFITEVPDGSSVKFTRDGTIYIAHPEHPVKRIDPDGTISIMEPSSG